MDIDSFPPKYDLFSDHSSQGSTLSEFWQLYVMMTDEHDNSNVHVRGGVGEAGVANIRSSERVTLCLGQTYSRKHHFS